MQTTLRDMGIECEYVWARFGSALVDKVVALYKKFILETRSDQESVREFSRIKARVLSRRPVAILYTLFVVVAYAWQILWKLWLPRILGKNLICDRYVYDTAIDLAVDLGYSRETFLKLLEAFLWLAPRPNVAFYIAVPETVAFSRKDDIPSPEYLSRRTQLYEYVAALYGLAVLDGSMEISTVHMLAKRAVLEKMEA
ncbi:MAG TPA: hypothetical protein G4O00_09960 [Thermoflexia bacterium]|jgi:dTMP kinase|nr:hypothetical protein [Thermoflexia bacterium]